MSIFEEKKSVLRHYIMKAKFFLLSLVMVFQFNACQNRDQDEWQLSFIPDGNYTGSYRRLPVWSIYPPRVRYLTFSFTSDNWSCSGDTICNGKYKITGDSIDFENDCLHSDTFDPVSSLSGKYLLRLENDYMEFERNYSTESADLYIDVYRINK